MAAGAISTRLMSRAARACTARCRDSPDRLPAEDTTRLYHRMTRIQATKSHSVVAAYLQATSGVRQMRRQRPNGNQPAHQAGWGAK